LCCPTAKEKSRAKASGARLTLGAYALTPPFFILLIFSNYTPSDLKSDD